MKATDPDVLLAREHAAWYRSLGHNPLPSRRDSKRPSLRSYAALRDDGVTSSIIDRWWAPNLQLALGARWDLCVVDVDGPEALDVWSDLTRFRPLPPHWRVAHDPRAGLHCWFAPGDRPGPLPFNSFLWGGDSGHSAIQLLGDRNLVVAPPSIHPRTGLRYRFLPGHDPASVARPGRIPDWILGLIPRPQDGLRPAIDPNHLQKLAPLKRTSPSRPARHADWRPVLDSIPAADKVALAASWGLRFATAEPNAAGWCACRSIHREDRVPSASFHAARGIYSEPHRPEVPALGFFQLSVELGVYSDFCAAVDSIAAFYSGAMKHAG